MDLEFTRVQLHISRGLKINCTFGYVGPCAPGPIKDLDKLVAKGLPLQGALGQQA